MIAVGASWDPVRQEHDAKPMTVVDLLATLGLVLPATARMPVIASVQRAVGDLGVAALPLNLPVVVAAELQITAPITLTVGDDHPTKCEHDHVVRA